ncbi:hypothetical protein L484_016532 [Morus notabilis]|uniref:Glycosyltransferase N-terminal domain-containing protein n=1 Tax=Morus notabilis TaxID=981085 RepID=W9QSI8_9ROSA|nr:hypothetical protein L484_016532 [Morus notabilis]
MNQSSSPSVVVVMVPFPAQSHLNQLLQLSHLIISSNNNLPIHYLASPAHNSQVKSRSLVTNYANNSNPNFVFNTKIIFHDLPIPLPSLLPTTSPDLLHKPMAALLHSLAPTATRLVIVYDILMEPFIEKVMDSISNAESCAFYSISAFTTFTLQWESIGRVGL